MFNCFQIFKQFYGKIYLLTYLPTYQYYKWLYQNLTTCISARKFFYIFNDETQIVTSTEQMAQCMYATFDHNDNFSKHFIRFYPVSKHCPKNVQIQSFFWSVFSCIWEKYGPEKTPYLDTFYTVKIVGTTLTANKIIVFLGKVRLIPS